MQSEDPTLPVSSSTAEPELWLPSARRCPSPNFNERPPGEVVSLLVIHNISLPPGEFSGDAVERFFQNQLPAHEHPYFQTLKDLQVSSHLFIRRSGELVQFVPLNKRAWHAGRSAYGGRENCNDFSVGIELEGTDTQPYTQAQYDVLTVVTKTLMKHFPALCSRRIVGHNDIAPGRKTDPGPAFDWDYYRSLI